LYPYFNGGGKGGIGGLEKATNSIKLLKNYFPVLNNSKNPPTERRDIYPIFKKL